MLLFMLKFFFLLIFFPSFCIGEYVYKDVKQEKQHNDLIHGVENFSPNSLKRTDTLEKMVLPNAQGMSWWIVNFKIAVYILTY